MNRIARFFDEFFTGYQYESDSGLYHVQCRSYDPTVGRWLVDEPVCLDEEAAEDTEALALPTTTCPTSCPS